MSDDWYSWIVVSSVRLLMFEPWKWDDDTHQFVFLGWVEPSTSMFKECSCSFCRLWWSTLSWQCLRLICSKLWVHNSYIFHWGCQKLEPSNARVYHHVLHHVSSKKGNVGVSPNFQRIWRFPEVSKMGGTPVPQIIQKLDHTCILALKPMVTLGSLILRNTHIQWFGFPSQCRLTYHELAQKMQPFLPTDPDKQSLSRKQHQLNLGFFILWPSKKRQFLAMMQPAATLW